MAGGNAIEFLLALAVDELPPGEFIQRRYFADSAARLSVWCLPIACANPRY